MSARIRDLRGAAVRHTADWSGAPGSSAARARRGARAWVVLVAGVVSLLAGPASARADVVLDWNAIASRTVSTQNPFFQARFMSITQLAVFEAVNAVNGGYEPYLGSIVAADGASAEAAAIAAAHRVLVTYFPLSAAALDADRAASLAAIPDGAAKTAGIAVGEAAALAMIALRASDGSSPPAFHLPGSTLAGEWQLTPSCSALGGVLYHWSGLTPFGIDEAAAFIPGPPPALGSNRYAKDYNEVRRVGSMTSTERPAEKTDVARFYASISPSAVANSAARQLAAARGDSLSENAWALALINMSINDSLIVSFATKYTYNLWRPETAIRAGDTDGNDKTEQDLTYVPLILTPCFPAYPSNHASGTNGGLEILRRVYGTAGLSLDILNATLGVTRHYTSLNDIAADVDDARVYGGIHFRFDQVAGNKVGRSVATYVYKHNLRKIAAPE